jgi:flagellar hook-basal body complex protein FliE
MPPQALTDSAAWPLDVPAAPRAHGVQPGAGLTAEAARPFAGVMQEAIAQVSQTHKQARAQLQSFRSGQSDLRWEEVAQSLRQAQTSLQEMMQLRQQLVNAYAGLQLKAGAGPVES